MKTIIEWYGMLPEPLKSQAFTNAMEQEKSDIFTCKSSSMYQAIDYGMLWSRCPEGETFWEDIASRWDEDTDTLRIPLMFSSSMRTMLLSMRHECKVAKILLRDDLTHTTFANYITMRGELCSYLPNGREHVVNDMGKWARNGRQDMKVGKMARNLMTELSIIQNDIGPTDFEKFTNLVKSYISVIGDEDGDGKKIKFEVVNGTNLRDAYYEDNYSNILGTDTNLWNSCMRYESCQDYLDIYVYNPNVVSLLVAYDSNNKVLGRALLWLLEDGEKAMDTIYAHDSLTNSFIQWANDNDYFYKSKQSCHHGQFDKHLTKDIFYNAIVVLKKYSFDSYPYMDTLSILEGNKLRNHEDGNQYKILKSTDGSFEEQENSVYDVLNNCDIHEDDAYYVSYDRPNGENIEGYIHRDNAIRTSTEWVLFVDCVQIDRVYYLQDDENITYIESRNEWHLIEDCVQDNNCDMIYIDDAVELHNGGWVHQDDAVELYNGDFAHEDEASQCSFDGEYYLNNDMTEFDGGMVHNGNIDAYHESVYFLTNKNTTENETKIA